MGVRSGGEWTQTTFRRVAQVSEGLVDPTDPRYSSVRLIAPNHIESGTGRLLGTESAEEQGADSGKYLARAGDILYSKIRPRLNKVTIAPEPCLCSADMYPIRLRSGETRFAVYWMLARPFLDYASTMADRVKMPKINRTELGGAPWLLPPISEQRAIADFLDRETAKIDALIEKQNDLTAILRERRQTMIHTTVTRGLRGEFLRPSGVAWIGHVPKSWRVAHLRRYAAMRTGHTPSKTEPSYWEDCTIPWFTLADVWQLRSGTQTYLGETKQKISKLGLANSAAELLPAGTVVLSRTASVGFSGIMPMPMATSQDFWNWVCRPSLVPEYLLYVFRAMKSEFDALKYGSTHQTIYQGDAAGFRIPIPPVPEQREIVDRLNRETAQIDGLLGKAEELITLARERRAALITAAVTGQIHVGGGD